MKVRVGVLSDTHLHRVTKDLKRIYKEHLSDKDLVLHAGDIVSAEVVDFLGESNLQAVHGNMDPVELKASLPSKRIVEVGGYRLGLIHGGGGNAGLEDRVMTAFQGVDAIIFGHSHQPVNHVREGVLLFNPGTATGFTYSGVHTLGVLELDEGIRGEILRL